MKSNRCWPALLWFACAFTVHAGEDRLRITPGDDSSLGVSGWVTVEYTLSPEQLQAVPRGGDQQRKEDGRLDFEQVSTIFGLGRVNKPGDQPAAMFGTYRLQGNTLSFVPRYRLVPGETYRAWLRIPGFASRQLDYLVPKPRDLEPAKVVAIFPSGKKLPANVNKFYLHFSQPMREGAEIFDHIRIEDDRGQSIAEPWRRVEIWSDNAQRFTLWVHPGRIKQGVNLREEEGPVFVPGKRYTLVVDAAARAAHGQPLSAEFRHTFQTTAEDHDRPLPQSWKLAPPKAETREPLVVTFNESLDRAHLLRLLTVHDSAGIEIAGDFSDQQDQSAWLFRPERPWTSGTYRLQVAGELEDLAGNTPFRVFDLDLERPPGEPPELALPFVVR